eukprot:GFKZ01015670.1.p1 GENE.GFKZ01015670.1~~GFKZ01015670.1.p1  ORF type:complete len:287 (-),score=68.21 GFKZ01015670.1:89-910(-)
MAPKETAFYDLLQVSPTATPAEIRKSFRLLALKHHPDRAGNTPEATAHFQHLRAVHDLLLDPDRRAAYDHDGDDGTLHGGDPVDADAAAAFFAASSARVSEEDILEYETRYRGGGDEREDLTEFFRRFEGEVAAVLDYIPYSDESDLIRFVRFWDAEIEKGELEKGAAYAKAKKKLLKKGKGKERDMSEGAGATAGKVARRKGGRGAGAADPDSLVAQILARKSARTQAFDQWAEGLAAKAEARAAEEREKRKRRAQKKKKGGITKKRRATET